MSFEKGLGADSAFDLGEVGELGRVALGFDVDHVASLVGDKDGTFSNLLEAGLLSDDFVVDHLEGFDGHSVKVGDDRDADLVHLGPSFLCERTVDGDGNDVSAEGLVRIEVVGYLAHLVGAGASEGEGEEEDDRRAFADVAA